MLYSISSNPFSSFVPLISAISNNVWYYYPPYKAMVLESFHNSIEEGDATRLVAQGTLGETQAP